MNSAAVETFLAVKSEFFPKNKLVLIKKMLLESNEKTFEKIQKTNFISPEKIIIVSRIGGFLGIDRFMIGEIFWGFLKLVTIGGFFIWWIIDWFFIMDIVKNSNYIKLLEIVYE